MVDMRLSQVAKLFAWFVSLIIAKLQPSIASKHTRNAHI
jgi:hypothetical protein